MRTDFNSLDRPIRWGIIGCGAVTEIKSGPALYKTEGFSVRMVMRRQLEKAQDFAFRHRIEEATDNADYLIQHPEIDAVYIATPPDTHLHYALKVAQAKKPCCVEKPLTPSFAESQALVQAFQEKQLPLFVSYYRRSLPRFLRLKEWIEQGRIGRIRHIHWQKTKPASDWDKEGKLQWRTDTKVAPGGYFDDLASHGLDLFAFLLGPFKSVQGMALNQQGYYTAKDAMTASWVHESGVTGSGYWNFGTGLRSDSVILEGSNGQIRFSVLDEHPLELLHAEDPNRNERVEIAHPPHIQSPHALNMKKHLLGELEHPSTGESALHCSWVMDQILGN
jgi:predicted dehydrogenase